MLGRDAVAWLARSSLCRLSSASFAFFARISSRRCCILPTPYTHFRQPDNPLVLPGCRTTNEREPPSFSNLP